MVVANCRATENMETGSERKVIMIEKALADKLLRLQAERKAKLNKAANIRNLMKDLIVKSDKTMVCDALNELRVVCDDAKCIHKQLLGLMPSDEQEKHEIWFKAKFLSLNECFHDAEMWFSNLEGNIQENVGVTNNEGNANKNEVGINQNVTSNENNAHATGLVVDDIGPDDSISNVESKRSSKGSRASGGSSTASARIKAEAERAALIARASALKERHALEEQEQQLRRKREQLDLEVEMAATNAKLAVLQSSSVGSAGSGSKNAMGSYLENKKGKNGSVVVLNSLANEYQPGLWKSMQQQCSVNPNKPLDVRSKERGQVLKRILNITTICMTARKAWEIHTDLKVK
uniref:uncharacterized protein LOC124061029 n=1 Tax=Scatophagus argus TaxID=75038 RepID=UPI001ED83B0B|nr:uncharacterized protein LOC124061029 [Scatophagus argus]XP_046248484.1 uncharacterized protein LOC124061029 [Scatophagus argus]